MGRRFMWLLAMCLFSCVYVQDSGLGRARQRYGTTSVYTGGESRDTNTNGDLPCDWLTSRAGASVALAMGIKQGHELTGLTFVRGGDECAIDGATTARALVTMAAGGMLMSPQERELLWRDTGRLDLSALEGAIDQAGGLNGVLREGPMQTTARLALAGALRNLGRDGSRIVGIIPDPAGLDDVEFSQPTLLPGGRGVRVVATIDPGSSEIKAVAGGNQVVYLKSGNFPDPLGFLPGARPTRESVTLEFPIRGSTEGPVLVIAPAAIGRLVEIVDIFRGRPGALNLQGELVYGEVTRRTLAGYAVNVLLSLGFNRVAEALRLGVGGDDPCIQAVTAVILRTSEETTRGILAQSPPSGILSRAIGYGDWIGAFFTNFNNISTVLDGAACARWISGGAWSERLGQISQRLDVANYLQENVRGVWDVGFGPSAAEHRINFCAACLPLRSADGTPIPACGAVGDAILCPGGGCDPAMIGTRCVDGVGACRSEGSWGCVDGRMRCGVLPRAAGRETCNGVDDDCDGVTDEGLTEACGGGPGTCGTGTRTCVGGTWGPCTGVSVARAEVCNGVDDDCDGAVDEGLSVWTCSSAGAERTRCYRGAPDREPCPSGCTAQPPGVDAVCCVPSCAGRCGGVSNGCNGRCDAPCAVTRTLRVDYPNGSERLVVGTSYRVTWSATGSVPFVRVHLREGSSVVDTLHDSAPSGTSGGSVEFTPLPRHAGRRFTIGVSASDDSSVADVSDREFDIAPAPVVSCDPREGTTCRAGVGECVRIGSYLCVGGVLQCSVTAGTPGAERCGNGLDDDCDGLADEGCPTSSTCPEQDLGSATGTAVAFGTTVGSGDDVASGCSSSGAEDVAFRWTAPRAGTFTFTTEGASYDTVLALRSGSCGGAELTCNDDFAGLGNRSSVTAALAAGQSVVIVVDGYSSLAGSYMLNIMTGSTCAPACAGRECGSDGCGGSCGTCAGGAACLADGRCPSTSTCLLPRRQCGAECVDILSDTRHCGGCYAACASGETCRLTVCTGSCVSNCSTEGATDCFDSATVRTCIRDGSCLRWDSGRICPTGQVCRGGVCSFP